VKNASEKCPKNLEETGLSLKSPTPRIANTDVEISITRNVFITGITESASALTMSLSAMRRLKARAIYSLEV